MLKSRVIEKLPIFENRWGQDTCRVGHDIAGWARQGRNPRLRHGGELVRWQAEGASRGRPMGLERGKEKGRKGREKEKEKKKKAMDKKICTLTPKFEPES